MKTANDPRFSLALAVLVAAPSAVDVHSAVMLSGLWAIHLGLSLLTHRIAQHLLLTPIAASLARVVVCTTLAAALLSLAPLSTTLKLVWPASGVLLALVAATAPSVARTSLMEVLGATTGALLLTGAARLLLPPMAPPAAAALSMAILAALLALRPRALQNAANTPDVDER